ncbi:MAG: hypothetical protein KatS3mg131_2892 [Candidatus Tectimicrobiota bacterium]|nr:MAG: hypothetical protein KatS3mg131_2892 [Candidatus Tectomicrobia bacterium]
MERLEVLPARRLAPQHAVPGSKSYTNRALTLAALARGTTTLYGALDSDDTRVAQAALRRLGVRIESHDTTLRVYGCEGRFLPPPGPLDLGNSGTAMRFFTAMLTLAGFPCILTGNARMQQRPIADLLDALNQLGAEVTSVKGTGCPPVRIGARRLRGGTATLSGAVSSQFLSALLMVAPYAEQDVILHVRDTLVSQPYVDMTLAIMAHFGVEATHEAYRRFVVRGRQCYTGRDYAIEGDASAATYFWGLAALLGQSLWVTNVPLTSRQADVRFLQVLERMGCTVVARQQGVEVRGPAVLRPLGRHRPQCLARCSDDRGGAGGFLPGRDLPPQRGQPAGERKRPATRPGHRAAQARRQGGGAARRAAHRGGPDSAPRGRNCHVRRPPPGHVLWHGRGPPGGDSHPEPGLCGQDVPALLGRPAARWGGHPEGMNVVLTGMRGTGKSSIGRRLAALLGYAFVDTDTLIEAQAGCRIAELVARHGWEHFRALERQVVAEVAGGDRQTIATGGGTLMDSTNAALLKRNGVVVLLVADLEVLRRRVARGRNRPSLTGQAAPAEELAQVWEARRAQYYAVADAVYDVSAESRHCGADVRRKAREIYALLRRLPGFEA